MWLSTKQKSNALTFSEAMDQNISVDGGLFVPKSYKLYEGESDETLQDLAKKFLKPYLKGDILEPYLDDICEKAFNFPVFLKKINESTHILELFHGPTAAFKDIGAQFLAECLSRLTLLEKEKKERVILVATSGDTGAAVASAFYKKKGIKVILLFPKGKVSPRQQKQLTCWGDNIHSFAVEGVFDDCQKMVKTLLADHAFSKKNNLTSANSINVGRLLPQSVYYAYASLQYQKQTKKRASFIIPSGNMGNAVACFWAKKRGLPIENIVLSTNENKVIPDFFKKDKFIPKASLKTLANAMDVGNPSNMERLLDLYGDQVQTLKSFSESYSVNDHEIKEVIKDRYQEWDYLLCPHTATAAKVKERYKKNPYIIVSTAHPAKFNEVLEPLIECQIPLPKSLKEMIEKPSSFETIPPEVQVLKKILVD